MPRIPRYTSQEGLNRSRIGAEASPSVMAAPMAAFAESGNAMFEIGRKFEEAQSWSQKQQAKLDLYQKQQDILTRASLDPDIDNPNVSKKYKDELGSLSTVADGIYNPKARSEFGYDYEVANIKAGAEIDSFSRKMIISKGTVTLNTGLDTMKETYTAALTPEDRQALLNNAGAQVDEAVRLGFMTPEEGYNRKKKTRKEWDDSAVTALISQDPTLATQQLSSGAFPEMTAQERADFLTIAERAEKASIKKAEDDLKALQATNEIDYAGKIINGQMTVADVYQAGADKQISTKFMVKAVNSMVAPANPKRVSDKKVFASIADKFADPDTAFDEISALLLTEDLDKKDKGMFQAAMVKNFDGAKSLKEDKFRRAWAGAWNMVKSWSKNLPAVANPTNAAYMVGQELLDAITSNDIPPEQILPTARNIIKNFSAGVNPAAALGETTPTDIMSRVSGTGQVGEVGEGKANVKINAPKKVKGAESGLWYNPQTEQIVYREVNGQREYRVVPKQKAAE